MDLKNRLRMAKAIVSAQIGRFTRAIEMHKRGQVGFGNLTIIAVSVGGTIVAVVILAIIVQTLFDDQTAGSAAANVSSNGLSFFQNLTSQTPLLGTVIILALVLAVVLGIFIARKGRGGGI